MDKETSDILDEIWKVVEILDRTTFEGLERAINEIQESYNPNKAYIELLQNMRTYKQILIGIE